MQGFGISVCGASRYGKKNFFKKVMLESSPEDYYQVSAFLYATARVSLPEAFILHSQSRESWDRESNWIGYIAATSDEATKALGRREMYVVAGWKSPSLKESNNPEDWHNLQGMLHVVAGWNGVHVLIPEAEEDLAVPEN